MLSTLVSPEKWIKINLTCYSDISSRSPAAPIKVNYIKDYEEEKQTSEFQQDKRRFW